MTIGEKLRHFADSEHGGITNLAELMDMKPPSLYPYLNDESIPGGLMLKKLFKLGCDINWLLEDESKIREPKIDYKSQRLEDLEQEVRRLRKAIVQFQNIINKLREEDT